MAPAERERGAGPAGARPERATPEAESGGGAVLRASPHHAAFLELTERTRGLDVGRALLDAEWRYLGPLLAGRPHPRVLDIACGTGAQTLAWAERGARPLGMDIDRALLARSHERGTDPDHLARRARAGGTAPDWACGDARRLPFRDGSFGVVFCNSLLEHVPDWRLVLAELARVLAPGGVLVVYTTNRHCPIQQEVNHFPFYSWLPEALKRPVMGWIMAHRRDLVNYTDFPAVNWFTFPGMKRAFRERGLTPFDRVDLAARGGLRGIKGAMAGLMRAAPPLRGAYYVGALSLSLYGVKDGAPAEPAPQR
jgi:ubiquinone/menaquinone biosynthesis C-methylase UbiE